MCKEINFNFFIILISSLESKVSMWNVMVYVVISSSGHFFIYLLFIVSLLSNQLLYLHVIYGKSLIKGRGFFIILRHLSYKNKKYV